MKEPVRTIFALVVVLLNALSFASLSYVANRKGRYGCSGSGGSMFGVTGGVLILGALALMPPYFPPPWSVHGKVNPLERCFRADAA